MQPLVSVMLPCFNAAATLPLALASLRAQTLADWECLCVDDGSRDATWPLLESVARRDPRFRIERFARNRGRGAARQRALEVARGSYLAFLDADDWMYPERLERQADWLAREPDVVLVSACAAVTVGEERVVGLMRPRTARPLPLTATFARPRPPAHWVFPASMVRTGAAQAAGFDPAFLRSQDSDFLVKVLLGRRYALMAEVLYAYSQGSAASLEKTLEGYAFRMRTHFRYWRRFPLSVAHTLAETAAKMLVYRAAAVLGKDRSLIDQRWDPADEAALRSFEAALRRVREACAELFDG
jgi:glycosyltransferase involved in cell wall biosynthesis